MEATSFTEEFSFKPPPGLEEVCETNEHEETYVWSPYVQAADGMNSQWCDYSDNQWAGGWHDQEHGWWQAQQWAFQEWVSFGKANQTQIASSWEPVTHPRPMRSKSQQCKHRTRGQMIAASCKQKQREPKPKTPPRIGPDPNATEEDWARRKEHRRQSVRYIKNTKKYIKYAADDILGIVPEDLIRPITPDAENEKTSKRAWENNVISWRVDLQLYYTARKQ